MKHEREFDIAFVGLKPGNHTYNYSIGDSFFESFEKPDFTNSQIEVKLTLDKKNSLFLLNFSINGKITISCDRCGDDFELNIWDEFELVVKVIEDELVEKKSAEDVEVAYVARSESILNVALWIYEFIILSVPIQHIHPDSENGESTCNPIALKILKQQQINNTPAVWEQLKKIK